MSTAIFHAGTVVWAGSLLLLAVVPSFADEPGEEKLTPAALTLESRPCGEGWNRWEGIADVEGAMLHRERITALAAFANDVWVGTSLGRILTRKGDSWTQQGSLEGIEITGIALGGDAKQVWLSTSDGIRRLDAQDGTWKVTAFRHYYEGHPSFVSGAYLPGEGATRLWGYVDGIYVPKQEKTYAPFVVSTEHGLFSWGGYGRVWHHFLPHYWGANSAWVDIRHLIPHRRPTCMVEDTDGNLWVGTQWDGFLHLRAEGRRLHTRKPSDNAEDATAMRLITGDDVGIPFDRVADVSAAKRGGVWAVLTSRERSWLARYDGQRWPTLPLKGKAHCVAELDDDTVIVGLGGGASGAGGVQRVAWRGRTVERIEGLDGAVFEIAVLPNGQVWAASWWSLYSFAEDAE